MVTMVRMSKITDLRLYQVIGIEVRIEKITFVESGTVPLVWTRPHFFTWFQFNSLYLL